MDQTSQRNKENILGDSQIPPCYKGMRPFLFTPDYQAVLYRGTWDIIDKEGTLPDPSCLIDTSSLLEDPIVYHKKKKYHVSRAIGFLSDKICTSQILRGLIIKSRPFSPDAEKITEHINQIFGSSYNGIVFDFYRNQADFQSVGSQINWNLFEKNGLLMLSLGAPRVIDIRVKKPGQTLYYLNEKGIWIKETIKPNNNFVYHLPLDDYSFTLMRGTQFHQIFSYQIPKLSVEIEEHANLTWISV